jgi:hypothetical protein
VPAQDETRITRSNANSLQLRTVRNTRTLLVVQESRSGRPVDVEVVLLGLTAAEELTWQVLRAPLGPGTPDAEALALAGAAAGPVSHSTSWRDEDGTLVLTYAVVRAAGPVSGPEVVLEEPAVVCSEDARRPAPPVLHGHHVVAHAVRHLSDLAGRDPVVAAALRHLPALSRALRAAALSTPVAPHAEAHALARVPHGPRVGPRSG